MDRQLTRQSGLTLLELLVVVAILALATTVAVFNAPPARSGAKAEAERFAARLVAGIEEAVMSGAPARVRMNPTGYAFERYDGEDWLEAGEGRLRPGRSLPANIVMSATAKEDSAKANDAGRASTDGQKTQWMSLDPIGVTDAYDVVFSDGRQSWTVSIDAAGKVRVSRDDLS